MILKCCFGLFALCFVVGVIGVPAPLLGAKECTWGPTYWCKNLTAAKSCNAVKHCIQTVWEHQELPEDNDDICGLCKKMVEQARDQLESNETMDELTQVLEGTCKLMYLKPVVKLCDKLADELVPELVDTLSSQMNPQVVCSVAGLCNNADIDRMLEDFNRKKVEESQKSAEKMATCNSCQQLGTTLKSKIDVATEEEIQTYLLNRCRSLGSYSDGCSQIMMEYLPTIMDRLKNHFTTRGFCHLTAACSGTFTKVEVVPESNVGVVHVNKDAISVSVKHNVDKVGDETCDLCKQLVQHLKDILIADTTELEFKQVLNGLCKQTGKFSAQCLSIVEEYYDKIYQFIAQDIKGDQLCSLADICPTPTSVYVNGPIWPLLPSGNLPQRPQHADPVKKVEITFGDPIASPEKAQLPLERLYMPQTSSLVQDTRVQGKQECELCQYFLHYVQKVITQPYGEDEIKAVVNKVCEEFPTSLSEQCKGFVSLYGDAFVAILAQEIDPSQVCPSMHLCPAQLGADRFEPTPLEGKPGCPLCLMAVEELVEKLKDNKTEESVKEALDGLCTSLPKSLQDECLQFVKEYTNILVETLVADLTPQEVCVYIKLCPAKMQQVEWMAASNDPLETRLDILTNEIPDNVDSALALEDEPTAAPQCVLCEYIMEKLEDNLDNNATEGEMERIVLNVCRALPSTVRKDCNKFMNKYSPLIIKLLMQSLDPSTVCRAMKLCVGGEHLEEKGRLWLKAVRKAVEECAVCEAVVGAVDGLLEDKTIDREITTYVTKICTSLPEERMQQCKSMLRSYGPSIINLLVDMGARPGVVCFKMGVCAEAQQAKVKMTAPQPLVGENKCTWGPSHWCASEENARKCGTIAHCREVVWKAHVPTN